MKKSNLKKCLQIIDKIESQNIDDDTFHTSFVSACEKEFIRISKQEAIDMFQYLVHSNNLQRFELSFDLSESLSIFSKSRHDSKTEALALFETIIKDPKILNKFSKDIHTSIHLDHFISEIAHDTILFVNHKINPKLLDECNWIIEDIKSGLNCSDALKTHFTKDLYDHTKVLFRNTTQEIISYPNLEKMKSIYPKKGIPMDRDSSKELQSFFKDCLFNEFKHQCCLCKASLPHLLIASHIKPFRDCGYLVEAMDSNNGLLLCRNHDYLFDQGYISFDDEGNLLISKEIEKDKDIYLLNQEINLKGHLSKTRRQFLKYHRIHYFKGN